MVGAAVFECLYTEREREKEREREERETDRQTDRQRQSERQTQNTNPLFVNLLNDIFKKS